MRPDVVDGGSGIVSITVEPATANIAVGATQQFTARATLANGMTQMLGANEVTWASSMTAVATIGANGVATGVEQGTVTISAALTATPTIRGQATLTVMGSMDFVSVQITPATATIAPSQTQQYTAIARRGNGMTVDVTTMATWQSATPATATINAMGVATGVAPGTTMITARVQGAGGMPVTSNSATLTVSMRTLLSIQLTPPTATLGAGSTATQQFRATGIFNDGMSSDITEMAMWSSSAPMIAAVSNDTGRRGLVTPSATMTGTANITASLNGVTSTPSVVTVIPSPTARTITINPPTASLPVGMTQNFTAQATFADGRTEDVTTRVAWASSATSVATVGASTGQARGVAAGMASITATFMNPDGTTTVGMAGITVTTAVLTSIEVTPNATAIPVGGRQTFSAIGTFSDMMTRPLTTGVNWSTTSAAIATISTAGEATAVSVGTTTVRAEVGTIRGSATLVVTPAVVSTITITPANPTVVAGGTTALTATATFTDGSSSNVTSSATWTTSLATVASVSPAGVVTGVAPGGPVTITARFGMVSGSTNVTVSGAALTRLEITPNPAPSTAVGLTRAFTVTGFFTVGSPQDLTRDSRITWSSSAPAIASISNATGTNGVATALSAGVTQINATFVEGTTMVSATPVALLVSAATIVSVDVTPATASTQIGFGTNFRASGRFTDMSTRDLTDDPGISWTTSDATVATVSNAPGSRGRVTGAAAGMANVTATFGGVSGSGVVTVSSATLSTIQLSPPSATLTIGGAGQAFTVRGFFSDGTSRDVTAEATFTSGDPARIVFAGNVASTTATATPAASVTVTARVTVGATMVSATATIRVQTTPTLTRIIVDVPATNGITHNSVIPVGLFLQARAQAEFTDGITTLPLEDFTSRVVWSSSDTAVARVDNAAATIGRITGVAPTTGVTITASFTPMGGAAIAGSTSVRVTNCAFGAVNAFDPANTAATSSTVPIGSSATRLLLRGEYSGSCAGGLPSSTFYDLSDDATATWTSANSGNAAVSNSPPRGQISVPASAMSPSSTVITVIRSGLTDTHTINVSTACINGVTIDPATANPTLPAGATFGVGHQFRATSMTLSDGSTVNNPTVTDLQWSAPTIALSNTGLISPSAANVAGTYTVTVGVGTGGRPFCAGFTAPTTSAIFVNDILQRIEITPATVTVTRGSTTTLEAFGVFAMSGRRSLTANPGLRWAAQDPLIADVNVSTGVVRGVDPGVGVITARIPSAAIVEGTSTVTVTGAAVQSISTFAADSSNCNIATAGSWPVGVTIPFTVIATQTDGVVRPPATSVDSIVSSDTAVVSFPSATTPVGVTAGAGTAMITVTVGGVSRTISVTVTNPMLNSIGVSGPGTMNLGTTANYTATGTYAGGGGCNLTDRATWSALPAGRVTMGSNGIATATTMASNAGPATIQAQFGTVTGVAMITVSGTCRQRIELRPVGAINTVAGVNAEVTSVVTFSDGTEVAEAPTSLTTSSANLVASLPGGNVVRVVSNTAGMYTVTATHSAGCGGMPISTMANVNVSAATLTAINVNCTVAPNNQRAFGTPTGLSLPVGLTQQCAATGTFSDGSSQDITNQVTWSSSNSGVASVDSGSNRGLVTPVAAGNTTITATNASGTVSGSTPLAVNTATVVSPIAVSCAPGNVPVNVTAQCSATATFRVGLTGTAVPYTVTSLATWSPDNATIATVENGTNAGRVTARAAGMTNINASFLGVNGNAAFTVNGNTLMSVIVRDSGNATSGSTPLGVNVPLRAFASYGAGGEFEVTSTAVWTTSNSAVATVSATGTASPVSAGSANIIATFGGLTGQYPLTVNTACINALSLSLVNPTSGATLAGPFVRGQRVRYALTATLSDSSTRDVTTDLNVVWNTSTGCSAGNCLRAPVFGLNFPPDAQALENSRDQNFNHTTETSLTLSARIAGCGGMNVTTNLPVTLSTAAPAAISINPRPLRTNVSLSGAVFYTVVAQFPAPTGVVNITGWEGLTWTVGNTTIATAVVPNYAVTGDSRTGFRGIAVGTTLITATGDWGATARVGSGDLDVSSATPTTLHIQALRTDDTTATGACRDRVDTGSWNEVGPTDPPARHPAGGFVTRLRAMLEFSDSTSPTQWRDVTDQVAWSIDSGSTSQIATVTFVSGQGAIVTTGATAGTGTVRGTFNSGTTSLPDSIDLTIDGTAQSGLQIITPGAVTPVNMPAGTGVELDAVGTFGTRFYCLTDSATWTSSNPTALSITSGIDGGSTFGNSVASNVILTASRSTFNATVLANVTTATLERLTVSPASITLSRGTTGQLRAFARFSDGSDIDITTNAAAQWQLRAGGTSATVNGAGLVTATSTVGVSTVDIRFTYGGTTFSTNAGTGTVPSGGGTPSTVTVN